VLAAAAGAVVAGRAVEANARGYRETLRFAEQYAGGSRTWAIEGTGSYGAGLARYLAERGETVLEVSRTPKAERRLRGKDDTLDAVRTARAALASDALALPRSGERREALRLLLIARRGAVDVRREALAQLRGVIVTAPDAARAAARAANRNVARPLQPPAAHEDRGRRRARDQTCAAQPRPAHRSSNARS
jgi:transposase